MKKKGFTLVELLVVMAVLSIFGVLILTIFTNSLRGGNKSQIIGVIKQNGQAVLETMDKTVRNSDNVVCISTTSPYTLIVVKNGNFTRYRFIDQDPLINPTDNGLIKKDNPFKQTVEGSVPPREETDAEFVNRVCLASSLMDQTTNVTTLTDTNPQTGVSVEMGSFVRSKPAGFKDQITISFLVKPGVSAPQAVAGQIDPVSFETTVQLR